VCFCLFASRVLMQLLGCWCDLLLHAIDFLYAILSINMGIRIRSCAFLSSNGFQRDILMFCLPYCSLFPHSLLWFSMLVDFWSKDDTLVSWTLILFVVRRFRRSCLMQEYSYYLSGFLP
jgi:hypothetical protein